MELYGPKKRGPKPKTFLLKVGWHCPMGGGNNVVPVLWEGGPESL